MAAHWIILVSLVYCIGLFSMVFTHPVKGKMTPGRWLAGILFYALWPLVYFIETIIGYDSRRTY